MTRGQVDRYSRSHKWGRSSNRPLVLSLLGAVASAAMIVSPNASASSPVETRQASGSALAAAAVSAGPAVDKLVVTHQSNASAFISSPPISTSTSGELILAFISSDGSATAKQSFAAVTGGGLSWRLRQRANGKNGTSEIWQAVAPATTNNLVLRADRGGGAAAGSLVVVAFTGADITVDGAVVANSAATGAPSAVLNPARPGSWVWAVGNDWDRASSRTVGVNQTKVDEYLAPVGDTFWVQRQTIPNSAGSSGAFTIDDTKPTNDMWNLAMIEVPAARSDKIAPSKPGSLKADSITASQVKLSWQASSDNIAVTGYQVLRNGAVVGTTSTATYSDGSLRAGTAYSYSVVAVDAAGNSSTPSTALAVTTTTAPSTDATAQTVAVTSPKGGATISGSFGLTADATDNVAVTTVQFLLDGANLGGVDTAAPYALQWDSTTVANGSHTITAVARDQAGNTKTSVAVSVMVSNISSSCSIGQVGTPPNCLPAPPGPLAAGKQWKVLFNDEFNGNSLNTANFSPCFDWNYGACSDSFNSGREHYDPSQVQVNGGTAELIAAPMSPPQSSSGCYLGSCTYKSGLISTSRPRADNGSQYLHPFTYGYVEASMKYPAVSGMFSAFWMLPTDPTYHYRSEIDIVEILGGDPDTVFMTYHYNGRATSYAVNKGDHNNGACAAKDYSKNFVRFGLDWEPTYVAWYIDGVKCGQFNGDSNTIENGPMQIILNMMVDNQWERDWGLTLANQSTVSQLEVDYLRVYQQQ